MDDNSKIKLMIVDDHTLLRQGFIAMFKYNPEFEMIADAPDGHKAILMLNKVKPDIILLDIEMPLMNGRETLLHVNKHYPNIKVVMLTGYADYIYKKEYMELGAHSFLAKGTDYEQFLQVLREVAQGKYYSTLTLNNSVIPKMNGRHLQLALNHREKEIIRFVCANMTNEDISKKLKISIHTVRYYRKGIAAKTHTLTIADLVKYAIRNGLISSD